MRSPRLITRMEGLIPNTMMIPKCCEGDLYIFHNVYEELPTKSTRSHPVLFRRPPLFDLDFIYSANKTIHAKSYNIPYRSERDKMLYRT